MTQTNHSTDDSNSATDAQFQEMDTPIDPWVFEDATLPSDRNPETYLDQMEELVDRLSASTKVPIEKSFDVAKEARVFHRRLVEEAEAETSLSDLRSLLDAFDRLVTAWVQSPTEIGTVLHEYRSELYYFLEGPHNSQADA